MDTSLPDPAWRTWREATSDALYGPGGFYRTERPADHFRTAPLVSAGYAGAIVTLARNLGLDTICDVGAGGGELLRAVHALDPMLRLVGVELAQRPSDLPARVEWASRLPSSLAGVLVANEWLDNVPVDVAEVDADGCVRIVLVEENTGAERLGDPVAGRDRAWLDTWWPIAGAAPGTRAEIGWPRDDAWAEVVRCVRQGVALAVDYSHLRGRRPRHGTLTGYRSGREVPPVPDGSCDITAHVAIDACAAAGELAGAQSTNLTTQRHALQKLGITARRAPLEMARVDPRGYLTALSRAGEYAELTARGGLGDHHWMMQSRDDSCRVAIS